LLALSRASMKWHKDKDAMEVVGSHQSFLVAVRGIRLLSSIADFFCTSQMPKKMFSIKIIFLKNNFTENIFQLKIL
jgi:hypothetical protein